MCDQVFSVPLLSVEYQLLPFLLLRLLRLFSFISSSSSMSVSLSFGVSPSLSLLLVYTTLLSPKGGKTLFAPFLLILFTFTST